jgi:hypothetical protein
VARDLRPTLAVRFVQLSELSVTRTVVKRRKESARQRRFVREEKKNSSSTRVGEFQKTKRAAALKTSFFDGTAADR